MTMLQKIRARQARRLWNRLAVELGRNAVLTGFDTPAAAGSEAAFMATGVADVDRDLARTLQLHPALLRDAALDFGCGLGRLSFALSRHFSRVVGVDASEVMISRASALRRESERITFVRIGVGLEGFRDGEFDFVYSLITLQHMPPSLASHSVGELLRVCRPGGIVCLQAVASVPRRLFSSLWPPTLMLRIVRAVSRAMNGSIPFHPEVQMYALSRSEIGRIAQGHGGTMLAIDRDHSAGEENESYRYIIRKGC